MPFTGLSSNERFTASQIQEDVARFVRALSPKETMFLDFLGDADVFASNIKHEFTQDFMLPNKIIASTAINSATAATGFQVNGLAEAMTVGTLLENEVSAEVMQVTSIPAGGNSVLVSRNYDGTGVGSLVAGGTLYVRGMVGIEGADHNGSSVRRLGTRLANTVGLFRAEVAVSNTDLALNLYGNDGYSSAQAKVFVNMLHDLEKEVLRGRLNSANSLASTSTTRTMLGLRAQITTINSTVTTASFTANPHLYLGDVWQQIYDQGGSSNETWAIVAGATRYRDISNLNDTKVQDSNSKEEFKRVIRRYTGPFGNAEVILARTLPDGELLLVPRERIKVVPLQGRSFNVAEMAIDGDNRKALITGEYTLEAHHTNAMARLKS
jgi:hypothetical protein